MNAELWGRAKEIYNSALERWPEQRESFVAEACGGDDALRQEVESMLGWRSKADNFIESPAVEYAARALGEDRSTRQAPTLTGCTMAHYEVLEKLGEGGMGVVYKARDSKLKRLVALKVLAPGLAGDPERKRRFIREARASSALNHPNIVTIYDIDQAGGIDYISMEYIPGKMLSSLIPRNGMSLPKALRLAVEIADALARAHAAGIIHRDLKPGNVMVGEDGRARVLDFGLAKLTEAAQPADGDSEAGLAVRSEEGIIAGTAPYMSPEQAQGKPVDKRSDIFSFGSMLYEMVTGRRAFQSDSKLSTLSKILNAEPEPIGRAVPSDLERIIQKCLRKEPEKRFQHIDDVKSELQDLIEESESRKLAQTAPGIRKRRKLVWALACTAALAVILWISWQLTGRFFSAQAPLIAKPLTTSPGAETGPTLSPDGRQVAFSWKGEKQDNSDIYVQQIGGPRLRLTTDPSNDFSPAWSPDGSVIAFLRTKSGGWSLNLISPLGGPERNIAELTGKSSRLAWSPDGKWLALDERIAADSYKGGVVLISPATHEKRQLLRQPAGDFIPPFYPTFSPDGKQIAFSRMIFTSGVWDLWVMPFPDGEMRQLTRDHKNASYPVWTPDGREIVFVSDRLGSKNLWRIHTNAPSGTEPRLIPETEGAIQAAISAGPPPRLVFARQIVDVNIWATEMSPDGSSYSAPKPLIHSTRYDAHTQFSPDGHKLAYVSGGAGEEGLWLADGDGSNPIQLTTNRMYGAHDWSPDGSKIAFDYLNDLYVIGASGGEAHAVLAGPASDFVPRWSRDGRSLYFFSDRSGTQQIWKVPAAGGTPVQLTKGGGIEGWETPDGKMFYYTKKFDAPGLWAMPVGGGDEKPVLNTVWHFWWAMADAGIYFVDFVTSKPPVLRFYDFGTQKLKTIMAMDKVSRWDTQTLTVTRDGRRIAWHRTDRNEVDLMQIENFR